jgi:hypothetical protein
MTPRRVAVLCAALVLAYGAVLSFCRSREESRRVGDDWVVLKDNVKVKARPDGVWTLALEWVNGPAVLKFEAGDEEWYYAESDAGKAKADGHLSSLLAAKNTVLPAAPVAALIGKIGGSSAGINDGTLFVVGKFCLLEIDRSKGLVYLTINDELSGFANNRDEISVKISSRPLATAPTLGEKPK